MNGLRLFPLRCPQCGSPGVVREGVRITRCDRCGSDLCLTRVATPRYEVESTMTLARAVAATRRLLERRGLDGDIERPELVLIPFHEVRGRRVGVFERSIPVQRHPFRADDDAVHRGMQSTYMYDEKRDTKVILAEVEHLTAAATPPWSLETFDVQSARRDGRLITFDLADAQRRATVFAEERSAADLAADRFAGRGTRLVGVSRATLFFPFIAVPARIDGGEYQVVFDGTSGDLVAWRLPELYSGSARTFQWLGLSIPGALLVGEGIRALLGGSTLLEPAQALIGAALLLVPALFSAHAPDWRLRSWPDDGAAARGEAQDGGG